MTHKIIYIFAGVLMLTAFAQVHRIYEQRLSGAAVVPVVLGDPVPDLTVRNLATGEKATLGQLLNKTSGGCSYVYFFDPACSACQSAAPGWSGIAAVGEGSLKVPVSWITLSSDLPASSAFLIHHKIPRDAYTADRSDANRLFGVVAVPAVWGVQNGAIKYLASGISGTSPATLPVNWCERDSDV